MADSLNLQHNKYLHCPDSSAALPLLQNVPQLKRYASQCPYQPALDGSKSHYYPVIMNNIITITDRQAEVCN